MACSSFFSGTFVCPHCHSITRGNTNYTRESFALELPTSFFPLLDIISSENASAERIHNTTIQVALEKGILKDLTDVAAVDSTLALHAATPTVQALYSFYEDTFGAEGKVCSENGAWVDWYGQVVCTVQELQNVINEERHVFLYSFVYKLTVVVANIHVQNSCHLTTFTHHLRGPLFVQAGQPSCTLL
jgi:hypothetical protein